MKTKDVIILNKILDYCRQLDEACDMFDNDYNNFVGNSVFQNACCMCILQIGELCKAISEELRMQERVVPWKEWCGIRDLHISIQIWTVNQRGIQYSMIFRN